MYSNPAARPWRSQYTNDPAILSFHKTLPEYAPTPLQPLPQISEKLGVGSVLIKDESCRFGLPAYKILGASWAVYRTVTTKLGLHPTASLEQVRAAAEHANLQFYTATDGNWGRAVARMASMLGGHAHVYVPKIMLQHTKYKLEQEGAKVIVVDGDYDRAVGEAARVAGEKGALFVADVAWPGYQEIPQWVVDGYSTMMIEIDIQAQELTGRRPDLVICPVGAGSLAQAVISHYKSMMPLASILTVEPETAACLMASLEAGRIVSVTTGETSMCGLNCGTVSFTAWPCLRDGLNAHITVTDEEAEAAEHTLRDSQIYIGPCGAATLAGLTKACRLGREQLNIDHRSVIVLLGTEAPRGAAVHMA